jgi:hypothetical protein
LARSKDLNENTVSDILCKRGEVASDTLFHDEESRDIALLEDVNG